MINLAYFDESEFSHPGEMNEDFLIRLDAARRFAGIPFRITSSYRPGDPRSHGRGLAVDIAVDGSRNRFKIVFGAMKAGFNRIGVYEEHIHLDTDTSLPLDVLWTGKSR